MLLRPGRLLHLALALAVIVPMGLAHADDDSDHPVKKKTKKAVDDASKVAAGGQGYGTAGCGLGSLVFGAQTGYIQIVSVTLNSTSGNQTFAITTGTLNCDIPQMGFQAATFMRKIMSPFQLNWLAGKAKLLQVWLLSLSAVMRSCLARKCVRTTARFSRMEFRLSRPLAAC